MHGSKRKKPVPRPGKLRPRVWTSCVQRTVTPATAICGYDLPDSREQVADAFTSLPEQKPSILILRLVLDLTDSEIGEVLGLSRSAVQRRRTKSLNVLRTKLTASRGKRVCRVAGGPEQYGWQRLTDIATAEAKAKTLTSAVRFDIRATPTRQSRL